MRNIHIMWSALVDFHRDSSWRLPLILLLMLAQSVTAGIGLLFIIPLLQLIGFDTGLKSEANVVNIANRAFEILGITPSLKIVLIAYIVIVTIIASLRYSQSVLSATAIQSYVCRLRNTLYRGLLETEWQFILSRKLTDFLHSLTIQVQSVGQANQLLLNLISRIVLSGIMVFLAFLLSWKMSLLALAFAFILLFCLLPLNRLIYGGGRAELLSFKGIFQMLSEQLTSLKMIKSYASEAYHADRVQKTSEAMVAHYVRFTRMHALTQWVYMVGAVIGFSIFFSISQTYLRVPLATTLLLLVIFSRLLPQMSEIQRNYQQLLHRTPALKDVGELQTLCLQHKEAAFTPGVQRPDLQRRLIIDNISYAYSGRGHIFQNFSTSIERHQTVALVGPSGSGKSTLADLVAGLLVPQAGTIYCDDIPLVGDQRVIWRESVAYVTQEIFLFNDTVRANLGWVADHPSEEALWSALTLAAADGFVSRLPRGLDTVIGDRGVRLSGGERQRLALARAILSEPQLLILDEATSALDNDNEMLIQKALKQLHGKLTILIIAHRETTLRHADKTIVLPQRDRVSDRLFPPFDNKNYGELAGNERC